MNTEEFIAALAIFFATLINTWYNIRLKKDTSSINNSVTNGSHTNLFEMIVSTRKRLDSIDEKLKNILTKQNEDSNENDH